eukprot:2996738-Lingulodinium_polyedra.AAC.1
MRNLEASRPAQHGDSSRGDTQFGARPSPRSRLRRWQQGARTVCGTAGGEQLRVASAKAGRDHGRGNLGTR